VVALQTAFRRLAPHRTGSALAQPQSDLSATLFDRLGARAWALAIWIVKDEELASEILVAAFAHAGRDAAADDADLLCDVRSRAVDVAGRRGRATRHRVGPPASAGGPGARAQAAVAGLPEAQREIIELAVLAGLDAGTIAARLGRPRSEVLSLLADALRTLQPALRHGGDARLQAADPL
jgi:DNA-directed RNA polymerase specialized sigma24 family protein